MMTRLEIQAQIDYFTSEFKKNVDSSFIKGKIVAFREMLGEDGSEVLDELHAIALPIWLANDDS